MSKKHKHEEHEEHVNHEAWVIPYADMLTLLMALFLVMWATQRSESEPLKIDPATAAAISEAFSAANLGGSQGVLEGIGPSPVPEAAQTRPSPALPPPSPEQLDAAVRALKAQQEIAGAVAAERNALGQAQADITNYLQGLGLADQVGFRLEERGLVVSIVSDQVLFDPGAAALRAEAVPLMDAVAGGLRNLPNSLIVEGHTDSQPISGGGFGSNWELSTARATSVLRYLSDQSGLDQRRLSATGYSDTRPVAPNETREGRGRNRRVEIVVVSDFARASQAPAPQPSGPTVTVPLTGITPVTPGGSQTPAQLEGPVTIDPIGDPTG